jgi:hypothetical protein
MADRLTLYFFDPRSDELQQAREAAIRQVLGEANGWRIVETGQVYCKPNFNLTVERQAPLPRRHRPTPALAYVSEQLTTMALSERLRTMTQMLLMDFRRFQEKGDVLDFSITFPGSQSVHSAAAEDGVITINYEYVVRHKADQSEVAILRKLQQLEYQADLRIKLASLDGKSRYVADACGEYVGLFADLPSGWRTAAEPVTIETRSEATRRAWLLSSGGTEVGAVEHETGLEFVLAIGGSVAAAATYDLIRWGLSTWLERRAAARAKDRDKAPTFLEIERTRRDADGQILGSETIRLRGPVADADLRRALERLYGD